MCLRLVEHHTLTHRHIQYKKDFGVNSIHHWMSASMPISPSQSHHYYWYSERLCVKIGDLLRSFRKKVHQMRFNGNVE